MRALVLTKKVPFPAMDGESLVIQQDIEMLQKIGFEIDVLALNTDKHYVTPKKLQEHTPKNISCFSLDINTGIRLDQLIKNFFSKIPYNIERFYSKNFDQKVNTLDLSNHYDLIIFEGLHLHVYLRKIKEYSSAKMVMRAHNVESEIWKRRGALEKNIFKKWYLHYLTKKIKQYETDALSEYDHFVAISERDLKIFKSFGLVSRSISIPYAIKENQFFHHGLPTHKQSIFFIGSFDWKPNYDGVQWFIKNVWHSFYAQFPDWKFYIAGRKMNIQDPLFHQPGIVALGEIAETSSLMRDYNIMIVPLFFGSGIRIKIIEALSQAKVIISTAMGSEGIFEEKHTDIIIADHAETFLKAITAICQDDEKMETIRLKNLAFAHQNFSFDNQANRLKEFLFS